MPGFRTVMGKTDLVEGGHGGVNLLCLPKSSLLSLEAEGGERAVVGA